MILNDHFWPDDVIKMADNVENLQHFKCYSPSPCSIGAECDVAFPWRMMSDKRWEKSQILSITLEMAERKQMMNITHKCAKKVITTKWLKKRLNMTHKCRKYKVTPTVLRLKNILGELGQSHGCKCPGSSSRQDISSHDAMWNGDVIVFIETESQQPVMFKCRGMIEN